MENMVPTLRNKKAFEEALKEYKVSAHGKSVLAHTPFVAVSGLAGGGRNTIFRILTEKYNYIFIVSDTTRPPKFRDGRMEQNGVDYFFRKEEDMLRDIQNGEFIEAEIIHNQQVSGTSIREVERAMATGKIPIHDFEYGGANAVARAKPDAAIIGLLPPNYDEWIRRLTGREELHEQEFLNRLVTAKNVLENMLARPYFKFVINDTLDKCVESVRRIVEADDYTDEMRERGERVAKELLESVNEALTKVYR
jgi:guanylate kinase